MRHPIESFLTEFNQYPGVVQKDLTPGKLPGWMNKCRLFCFRSEKLTDELLKINADLAAILLDYSKQMVSIEKCLSKISDALDYACFARATAFLIHHPHLPVDRRFEKGRFEDHVTKGLEALKKTPGDAPTTAIDRLITKAKFPQLVMEKRLAPLNPLDVELSSTSRGPQQSAAM